MNDNTQRFDLRLPTELAELIRGMAAEDVRSINGELIALILEAIEARAAQDVAAASTD